MSDPSRIEKMVGTILGLRMIVTQLLAAEAARGGGETYLRALREAATQALEGWPIGSDTPESAENIRRCAIGMVSEFPGPTKIS